MRRLPYLLAVLIGMIVNPALGDIFIPGPIFSNGDLETEVEWGEITNSDELAWLFVGKLEGSWNVTDFWQNGKRTFGDKLAGLHYSFANDTMQWGHNELGISDLADGVASSTLKFKLDDSKTPMHMDAETGGGARRAIYSIDQDTLVICAFSDPKRVGRPKSIPTAGKPGDGLNILVLTRVPDSTTWKPDKHGILRDPAGRPMGWWGVDSPATTTANRR